MKWWLVVMLGCARAADQAQLVDVKRDDLVIGIEVTGELEAVDSTDIKPPALPGTWDFKVAMMAPEGTEVKVGDPIIGFDPSNQMRDLENVQNEADEAKKKVAKKRDDAALAAKDADLAVATAKADLDKKLLKTNTPTDLVGSIELETNKLDVEAAKLALERAQNKAAQQKRSDQAQLKSLEDHLEYVTHRVEQLQQNVAKMQVTAPRAGTLVYPLPKWRWPPEKTKVGDQVWKELVVEQVVGLGKMVGKGEVDEVDSARVAEQQPVSLRLDALPDVQLRGKIAKISRSLHAKSQADPSKVVELEIALDPAPGVALRPNMRFRGQVEIERVPQVVLVPVDAVFVTADGPVAYVDRDGTLAAVKLQLGRRSASAIEVKAGLAPGDRVSRSVP